MNDPQPKVAQPKPKKIVSTPRAERSTAEGTPEVQNLLFYKQFETRLQELKQIWNEIRGQKPVKEEKRETTIIPGVYKWYFVSKIVLTYCEKKFALVIKKHLCKLKAEG